MDRDSVFSISAQKASNRNERFVQDILLHSDTEMYEINDPLDFYFDPFWLKKHDLMN